MLGSDRGLVDFIKSGIQVNEGEFKRTFIAMKFVRKVELYFNDDNNSVRTYVIRITYGESALDTLLVRCSDQKEAEDFYTLLIQNV